MGEKFDFSGWATKNDLKCSDGRTIRHGAFSGCNGQVVPLVWQHQHNSPNNVLGHALLEERPEGMWAYGKFNNTEDGLRAKELVQHGDIKSLSIYANQLKQNGGDVLHGIIREVSLVLAGANPGASIIYPVLEHSGETIYDEAVISTGENLCHECDDSDKEEEQKKPEDLDKDPEQKEDPEDADKDKDDEEITHADEGEKKMADKEKTVKDVFDELTDEQKKVVYFMIGQALEDNKSDVAKHSDEEELEMKHNVFDGEAMQENVLSHAEIEAIFADAKRIGSLKESVLMHAEDEEAPYGIEDIQLLFPDYKTLNNAPDFIKRRTEWVDKVMGRVHHTPFSRIKSLHADIREDEARAKGYVKGNKKFEEVFSLLKRTTDPQTVYKKQKLDRDDILDITSFDVVAWLKAEMRGMLDEELARAILIGDGRSSISPDKISPDHIRPIWGDDDLYTINKVIEFESGDDDDAKAKKIIRQVIKARKDYRGSGNPVMYTTEDMLTNMLLLEDGIQHRLYKDEKELATALRVSEIVTVPVMEAQSRTAEGKTYDLAAVIVNLTDYNIGADKGGQVSMFEDFDIDFNQEKYLMETRCSGALTKPFSAVTIETVDYVEPEE